MKESNKQFDDVKASLHTEALKLADELEKPVQVPNQPDMIYIDGHRMYGAQVIRRLVEELDTTEKAYKWTEMARNAPTKPLSADEMYDIAKQFLQSYYLDHDEGLYGETSRVLMAIEDWYGFIRAIEAKIKGQQYE